MDESSVTSENLSEDFQSGQTQNSDGTEQVGNLERLVESIEEEQATLRKSHEELLQENQELRESLQQLQPDGISYLSIAALIISILSVMVVVFINKKLMIQQKYWRQEFSTGNKSSAEKISKLDREIQNLNSLERELSIENKSFVEKISKLEQEIQHLNLLVENYVGAASSPKEKAFSEIPSGRDSPKKLEDLTVKRTVPPVYGTSFIEDFNILISRKDDTFFSKELETFLRKYKIRTFSCSNSQELVQNSDIMPTFKESSTNDSGDYWAYEDGDCYLVVPAPYVQNYTNSVDIGRAFGKVFESNFNFGDYFTNIKLEKPAVFKKNGVQWILKSRGKLMLE